MRNYSETLLDPSKCVLLVIDHQPQMYFGVESVTRGCIMNNITGLVKAAQTFNVPVILTTVEAKSFSGMLASKIQQLSPKMIPIDRTNINSWEDANLKRAVESTGKKDVIISGLWTEACVAFPALCMKKDGYNVYVAVDACGGASVDAHDMAVQRMTQAGIIPVTWLQVMLEFQRDWNNKDNYDAVMQIIKDHSTAYGLSVEYSETMVNDKSMLVYQ